ncbi:TonB-linked outer membrane protein, SusC/RagA family [Pustulibacterium marinum]|uniref:TonB-linked outer membrane protein, SusC/RagA family n=1 Tax=Pustulibacterium marinum TaxID=1224947 RepID=A0A1I7HIN1_9FLAO|nr:TonB-dependent receptor [Pustulibacterium marinum]SFU60548.1 TonB-linked outer membrane protein, SusC/RagA family [Pustulibacterium marinum]
MIAITSLLGITFKSLQNKRLLGVIFAFVSVLAVQAQTIEVTGTITSEEDGMPLPGASIMIQGTSSGTSTDFDGNYTLSVESGDVLEYSFVGFQTQEITVENQTTINVVLKLDATTLEDVVVVGYGTRKKSDLTGSVAVVDVDEMKKVSNSNVGSMLQGKVTGINVTADGQPGADPTIRIRGVSTFGDASPLYVIDGVPVGTSIRDFSPSDIESIQVLKDASAAAIYGSRAANGVVIITTKQGRKEMPLKIDYKGYYGVDDVYQRIPVLGRSQYQEMANLVMTNSDSAIYPANDPNSEYYIDDVDTDWQDAGYKMGIRQDHNLNFSGGGTNNTYNYSLDYFDRKGTLEGMGPDYTRYSVKANNTFEKGIFKIGTSLTYTHTNQNSLNSTDNGSFAGGNPPMVVKLLQLIPTMKLRDNTTENGWGTYDLDTQGQSYSLNIIAVNNMMEQNVEVNRILANGWTEVNLGDALNLNDDSSLTYKLNLSYNKIHAHDFNWVPEFYFSNFYTNTVAKLNEGDRIYTDQLIENTVNYKTEIGEHKFDVLGGYMFQRNDYYTTAASAQGFSEPYIKEISAGEELSGSSYESHHTLMSFLARFNYDYSDRYSFTATIRRDGSSRFGSDNRFGNFPSLAVAWKLHNEDFLNLNEDTFNQLKLRASWGKLGNENIGEYGYSSYINRSTVYNFGGSSSSTAGVEYGAAQDDKVDENIKWETKRIVNIGLDATMFNNTLDFSAEYYNSRSTDILVGVTVPYTVGSVNTSITTNAGTLENSGFELSSTYHAMVNDDLRFDISANITTLKNKVIKLGENGSPIYGTGSITREGQEVGMHYGYVYEGIFQNQGEIDAHAAQDGAVPGDIKFKDLNNDGTIDSNDRTELGSGLADFTYGFNIGAYYKNWDFTIFATGASGLLINSNVYRSTMHTAGLANWHEDILNSWTPDNTNTNIPIVKWADDNGNDRNSNRPGWLQNGNYLRLATVSIGYNFEEEMIKKVFSSARVYITGQNLYTFTKYKGYNPAYSNGDAYSPGYDAGSYPVARTFMLGVNLGF